MTRLPAHRITCWCGFGTSAYSSFWDRRTSKRLEGPHSATIFSFSPCVANVGWRSTRPSWIQLISHYFNTLHTPGSSLDPRRSVAAIRAGWSRDTTGYNPRSNIIEGGSSSRVDFPYPGPAVTRTTLASTSWCRESSKDRHSTTGPWQAGCVIFR